MKLLILHLPAFLKQVITDFHAAQHTEAAHRFWIEAVSIPVSLDEDKLTGLGVQHLEVDIEPEIMVRKHKLMRNADGDLIDDPNDHDGWFFYLLNDAKKRSFDLGEPIRDIKTPAIYLYPYSNRIRFLDNNERSNCVLQGYDDQLLQFFDVCKADETGLIIETPSLSQQSYRLIKKIESQTGKPTHFSPEYIFAQEFTKYYNEFALYFPVFNRLKELCRCMTLVRLLKSTLISTEMLLINHNQTLQQLNRIQSLVRINEETLAGEGGRSGGGAGGGSGGGSSSGRFNRQNIIKGFQDHHIVSDKNKFTKNHKLIQLAGANLQSRQNRIYLPKQAASHPTRSIHMGRHYNAYSRVLGTKMNDAVRLGNREKWTQQQYHRAYSQIIGEFRAELKAGNIALNKHARPWASPSYR